MWRCVSIMPGMTMPREASISSAPSGASSPGPTASIFSPTTSTSPSLITSWASFIVRTVPWRNTIGRPALSSLLMWLLSRDEDLLRAAGCAPLALPRLADLVQRPGLDVHDDAAVRRVPGQPPVRLALELERRVGYREAADVDRLQPDERRGQRDLPAGHVAHLDVAGEAVHGAHGRERRRTPEHVERHVDLAFRRRADRVRERLGLAVLHVRTGAAQTGQALWGQIGGDDAARAEQLGRLHRDAADGAAGAEHQHGLAGLQLRAPLEREPGRKAGVAECGGHGVLH